MHFNTLNFAKKKTIHKIIENLTKDKEKIYKLLKLLELFAQSKYQWNQNSRTASKIIFHLY